MPDRDEVMTRIGEIEAEMKRIGVWSDQPPSPEAYNFQRAFAMDTMAFSQWLQFIFVARVHQIVETGGTFPTRSQVGAQAIREFDGYDEAADLVNMLNAFDALIEQG